MIERSPTVDKYILKKDENESLCCPFCGECDFDKIGLKGHLEYMACEVYNNTELPKRLF